MITYRNLGYVGRLGNALFELAATIGIAEDLGEDVIFPEDWLHRPFFSVPDELFGPIPAEAKESTEFVAHMDSRALPYLQDVNLFSPYLDLIREYLQPSEAAIEILSHYDMPPAPRLSVHVRRGDNVVDPGIPNKQDYHYLPDNFYYLSAAATWSPTLFESVAIFSDDIPWCKRTLPEAAFYGTGRPYYKEHEALFGKQAPLDWIDLFLMSRCDYFVITGSTYGIWGALLANVPPDRVVHCDKVFGPIVAAYTNSALMFLPEWRTLAV